MCICAGEKMNNFGKKIIKVYLNCARNFDHAPLFLRLKINHNCIH